jgi:MSHA pilin protein MshA
MQRHAGFTLVELIIVIIILGLLAAIAVPKFIEWSADAKMAATQSVAASLSAVNAVNYAARKANATQGIAVNNCQDLTKAFPGGLATGYTVASLVVTIDTTTTCTLIGPAFTSATFSATGIL